MLYVELAKFALKMPATPRYFGIQPPHAQPLFLHMICLTQVTLTLLKFNTYPYHRRNVIKATFDFDVDLEVL